MRHEEPRVHAACAVSIRAQQKYYLQDPATGEIAGLYLWESQEALAAYRESELRASIAKAYQAEGEPRVEVYRVVKTLRDDRD
jgi:hypothetical protein